MLIFQLKKQYSSAYLENIENFLPILNKQNYANSINYTLNGLHQLSQRQKAQAANELLKQYKNSNLSDLQKSFLYEAMAALAPAAASWNALIDYSMDKNKFRQKNGRYSPAGNNCRHYALKSYYKHFSPFFSFDKNSLGKNIHGRASEFDYYPSDLIERYSKEEWDLLSQVEKEKHLKGKTALISYTFENPDEAKGFLQPGDLIMVPNNPRTSNAHVGIYTQIPGGEGEIVHIGSPLHKDDFEFFASRSSYIRVYRVASRASGEKP